MVVVRSRIIFITLAISSCALLGFLYFIHSAITDLTLELDQVKLKNERLLSEKLSVEKSLLASKKKLNTLEVSQTSLSNELSMTMRELKNAEKRNELLNRKLRITNNDLMDVKAGFDSLMENYIFSREMNASDDRISNDGNDSLSRFNERYQQLLQLLKDDPSLDNFFISDVKQNTLKDDKE